MEGVKLNTRRLISAFCFCLLASIICFVFFNRLRSTRRVSEEVTKQFANEAKANGLNAKLEFSYGFVCHIGIETSDQIWLIPDSDKVSFRLTLSHCHFHQRHLEKLGDLFSRRALRELRIVQSTVDVQSVYRFSPNGAVETLSLEHCDHSLLDVFLPVIGSSEHVTIAMPREYVLALDVLEHTKTITLKEMQIADAHSLSFGKSPHLEAMCVDGVMIDSNVISELFELPKLERVVILNSTIREVEKVRFPSERKSSLDIQMNGNLVQLFRDALPPPVSVNGLSKLR